MKSPPSYQESRNQFKINNEQQEQRQAQPQRPYQQSDLIYEHQNTSKLNQATTTAASSKIQNQNNLNFKQYFEGLKHAKKEIRQYKTTLHFRPLRLRHLPQHTPS